MKQSSLHNIEQTRGYGCSCSRERYSLEQWLCEPPPEALFVFSRGVTVSSSGFIMPSYSTSIGRRAPSTLYRVTLTIHRRPLLQFSGVLDVTNASVTFRPSKLDLTHAISPSLSLSSRLLVHTSLTLHIQTIIHP